MNHEFALYTPPSLDMSEIDKKYYKCINCNHIVFIGSTREILNSRHSIYDLSKFSLYEIKTCGELLLMNILE